MGQRPSVGIIGGGISGLWLAEQLVSRSFQVKIFERSVRVGGRVHSMRDFECGAFRVHKTHTRVLDLAKRLGVRFERFPLQTEFVDALLSEPADDGTCAPQPGLTWWDVHALSSKDMHAADVADARTGYRSSLDVHSVMGVSDEKNDDGTNWLYAPEGLEALATRTSRLLPNGCAALHTLVTNVLRLGDGRFEVRTLSSDGKRAAEAFDFVVFACSPLQTCDFDVFREHGKELVHAVEPSPLMRIYARSALLADRVRGKRVVSASLLQQTLHVPAMDAKDGDAPTDWVQVSYSEGQAARFWQDVRLSQPRSVLDLLTGQVSRVFGRADWKLADVEMHFWERAVHKWRTAVDAWSPWTRVSVNAATCPGAFVCGEALSTHQSWIEGALETAELVLQSIVHDSAAPSLKTYASLHDIPKEPREPWIVVRGRVLRVDTWADVHPGGKEAIEAHVFTDATTLFEVIHGPLSLPWRTLCALQIAWLKP